MTARADDSGWRYFGSCADGEPFAIDGVDVWTTAWTQRKDEFAEVRDPLYQQRFRFPVYELRAAGGTVVFAAGEFSNCIWGFYRPGSEAHPATTAGAQR